MSTLLSRPPHESRPDGARQLPDTLRPRWQAAPAAIVAAAAGVLVPLQLLAVLGWAAADTTAGILDAVAVGTYGWLLGHGVPLTMDLSTGPLALSLRPLGLVLVVLGALHAAAARAARASGVASLRGLAVFVGAICVGYAGVVTGVAALTLDGPARQDLAAAAVGGLALALVGAGSGALRASALLPDLRRRLPRDVRVAVDAGAGAGLVLAVGAALVLAASLAVHFSRAVGLGGALDPGASGWPLVVLLNLVLLPNAGVYALSYAAGPGFALGVGTSVSLGGTTVGPVPAVAVMAAVPESSTAPPYAYAVLLIPLAAGVTAGLLAVARAPGASAERSALRGCYAGMVVGLLAGALAWAAGGSLGTGRLTAIGPTGWLVGLAVAVEVGVIAAVTAWVACPRATSAATSAATSTYAAGARPTAVAAVAQPAAARSDGSRSAATPQGASTAADRQPAAGEKSAAADRQPTTGKASTPADGPSPGQAAPPPGAAAPPDPNPEETVVLRVANE